MDSHLSRGEAKSLSVSTGLPATHRCLVRTRGCENDFEAELPDYPNRGRATPSAEGLKEGMTG